jgi:hypothetical protein
MIEHVPPTAPIVTFTKGIELVERSRVAVAPPVDAPTVQLIRFPVPPVILIYRIEPGNT